MRTKSLDISGKLAKQLPGGDEGTITMSMGAKNMREVCEAAVDKEKEAV